MKCLICLIIVFCGFTLTKADLQKVTVKGQVICDKRSVRNILVELREFDSCKFYFELNLTIS